MIWCGCSLSIIITQLIWWHSQGLVCFLLLCRSVMLDRAETLLHDHYAGKDYWDVSQSMVQNDNSVNICVLSFYFDPITVCNVMQSSLQFSMFNVDPPQYGFCQALENHWRRLQSKVPELHRWQRLHGLQWGLDPHESESAYQVVAWLCDHAGRIKAVEMYSAVYVQHVTHYHFTHQIRSHPLLLSWFLLYIFIILFCQLFSAIFAIICH